MSRSTPRNRFTAVFISPSKAATVRREYDRLILIHSRGRQLPPARSKHYGLVRKLVFVYVRSREMAHEDLADFGNTRYRAGFVVPGAIRFLHARADRVPFVLRNPARNAPINDDLDLVIDELHIDQHAGVLLRIPYPQQRE